MGKYDSSRGGQDFKAKIKWDYRGDIREYCLIASGRVSMSQVRGKVKGGFSFNSRRTMRGPQNLILRNSQLKGKSHF